MTHRQIVPTSLVVGLFVAASAMAQTNLLYFKSHVQSGTGEADFIGQGWEQTWTDVNADFFGDANGFESVDIIVNPKTGEDPPQCWGACSWTLQFDNQEPDLLSSGSYFEATSCPSFSGPCISFEGDTRGCNDILGEFLVLEVGYLINQADGKAVGISKFAADFSQKCLDTFTGDPIESVPSLDGVIRFNSNIPQNVGPLLLDGFESGNLSAWSG